VITGALSLAPQNKGTDEAEASLTRSELAEKSLTVPFTHIVGDPTKIQGSDLAALPVRKLRAVSLYGFANDEKTSIDGIRRVVPLLVRVQNQIFPSLALQVLCQMLSVDPDSVEIRVGKYVKLTNISGKSWKIPINEAGEYLINYRKTIEANNLSYFWLFQNLQAKTDKNIPLPPECDIENKVLFIGQSAVGLSDLGPTPYTGKSPLAYVHLDVINNVLQNDYLTLVPLRWLVAGWLILTWATLFRLSHCTLIEAVLLPVDVALVYTLVTVVIFWLWSIQLAFVWPVVSYSGVSFGVIVVRWLHEVRIRNQLRHMFSRMISPEVMELLLADPSHLELGGSKRTVTIMFMDIRDYTGFSEGMDVVELIRQLNEFFERMVNCIIQYRGTVHKFMGDSVMAVWGDIASVSGGDGVDARNAVRAALLMRRELRQLNVERQAADLVHLRIGIGLNHGQVVVGQIGATLHSEFACIGDPVNVASRLQGITKTFHTDLAIGESVRWLLGDEFLVRRLGLVLLKGKKRPTVIYEVLGVKDDLPAGVMPEETVALYEHAFDHYLNRRFNEAEAAFSACQAQQPDDFCVKYYLDQCRAILSTPLPLPKGWDGQIMMESK